MEDSFVCCAPLLGAGLLRSTFTVVAVLAVEMSFKNREASASSLRASESTVKFVSSTHFSISALSALLGTILSPVTVLEHDGHWMASRMLSGRMQRAQKFDLQQGTVCGARRRSRLIEHRIFSGIAANNSSFLRFCSATASSVSLQDRENSSKSKLFRLSSTAVSGYIEIIENGFYDSNVSEKERIRTNQEAKGNESEKIKKGNVSLWFWKD